MCSLSFWPNTAGSSSEFFLKEGDPVAQHEQWKHEEVYRGNPVDTTFACSLEGDHVEWEVEENHKDFQAHD